jgi:pantoate--beta-alanine ligase
MFDIVRNVNDLRERVASWRDEGLSIGLVPTMGALHLGHMALVARSLETCDRTLATLFINPKQFGEGEDLESYPRDEQKDAAKLELAGTHLLFAPTLAEMYPDGYSTGVRVGGLGDVLDGVHRPGFFDSVATVVSKLLNQAGADRAFFGKKDYQQLLVIKRMARDLDILTVIEGVETVREDDGLALSSRNVYLSDEERQVAPVLFKTLTAVAQSVRAGNDVATQEAWGREQLLSAGFSSVDYFSVHDAETLQPGLDARCPGRVLAAAKLGRARLIDNVQA